MRVAVALALTMIRRAPGNAADKRRQTLDPMDQSLLQQEFQCPVHRRRCRPTSRLPQSIQQFIGPRGRRRVEYQSQHMPAQLSQPGAAMLTDSVCPIEQVFGSPGELTRHCALADQLRRICYSIT